MPNLLKSLAPVEKSLAPRRKGLCPPQKKACPGRQKCCPTWKNCARVGKSPAPLEIRLVPVGESFTHLGKSRVRVANCLAPLGRSLVQLGERCVRVRSQEERLMVRDLQEVPTLIALNGLATAVGRATGAASAVENGTLEESAQEAPVALMRGPQAVIGDGRGFGTVGQTASRIAARVSEGVSEFVSENRWADRSRYRDSPTPAAFPAHAHANRAAQDAMAVES